MYKNHNSALLTFSIIYFKDFITNYKSHITVTFRMFVSNLSSLEYLSKLKI